MAAKEFHLRPTAALLLLLLNLPNSRAVNPIIINSSLPEISYVMEPFDSLEFIASDDLNDLSLSDDSLFGNFSLQVEYRIRPSLVSSTNGQIPTPSITRTPNGTIFTTLFGDEVVEVEEEDSAGKRLGWIPTEKPHNCHGATHLSIWYKMKKPGDSDLELRLTLLDDGIQNSTEFLLEEEEEEEDLSEEEEDLVSFQGYSVVLPLDSTASDWKELRVPMEEFTGDDEVNGLRLYNIRGWEVEIRSSLTSMASENATVVLLDQLACIGGGDLLGASFYLGEDMTWEEAIEQGIWIEEFYQSEFSQNHSQLVLEDGVLSIDYTVMMVETWGGFTAFSYFAPGPAYYNLTGATDWHLSYHSKVASSVPGRTHLRIVVSDASHCTVNCSTDPFQHERWYSFHYVLDDNVTNDGWGEIHMPLIGSLDPSTPLWLTKWAGITGNEVFDMGQIKGFTLEFNIDSQGEMNSTSSGAIEFLDLSAMVVVYNDTAIRESIGDICTVEPDLHFRENSALFQRIEFMGNKCCELCQADETCLYGLSTGRDCYLASYIQADMVGLLNLDILQKEVYAFWVKDEARRGDFCDRCDCREDDLTIDCQNSNLTVVPGTFPEDLDWTPRVLDLRNNTNLVLLGANSMESIAEGLEEVWLPKYMRHISVDSLKELPKLSTIHYEDPDEHHLSNTILDPADGYHDVCCSRGYHKDLSFPSAGATFCHMEIDLPGVDCTYLPFIEYQSATPLTSITPSSNFMFEAAESPEKCAEYCSIVSDCQYFSYDKRFPNAEHVCHLLLDSGAGPKRICCDKDHYADDAQTIPGWTSGLPPRTRHVVDNARVLVGPAIIDLDPESGYVATFEVSLGSTPLRGAVWVTPSIATVTDLDVSFEPPRVVLYDANTTAAVVVKIYGIVTDAKDESLVVNMKIETCDEAFVAAQEETSVFLYVGMPRTEEESNLVTIIVVCLAVLAALSLGVFVYFEQKRKANDSVWKVQKEELVFAKPPEVLGRGTFGLVLKATYRGTEVAVKRVIPPKEQFRKRSVTSSVTSTEGGKIGNGGMASGSIKANGILVKGNMSGSHSMQVMGSQTIKKRSSFSFGNIISSTMFTSDYSKLKKDFVEEMRHLSKLRHPCIINIMGAVINAKSDPMLVMELMEHGSLWDLLHNETMVLDGELLLPILRDISQGMRFLHAANPRVIHGDLKAANILVDTKFRAKVADFGLSTKRQVKGATGTPYWMAPELLRGESTNTCESDVYAFGIILYEVYSRKDPYDGEDIQAVLRLVADKKINKRPPVPRHMPAPIQSLMSDCLVEDPSQRPTSDELDVRLKRVDVKSVEPTHSENSKKKSSSISLFDIFPRHIAEALRDGKEVEAEHKDCVTIFFSDIVGFTTISSTLSPRKVANMLDRLYSKFDQLSHDHDLYKVETIGDAYMCCGNLVKDQRDDHAKRIAEFAIDAVQAARTVPIDADDPDSKCVEIRVGFHSGAIVADVVGTRNPRFCLFGDTVNVASRMESTSEPGRIHCSKASAELLKTQAPDLPLASRGKIKVKGKGEMSTYWVDEEQILKRRSSGQIDPLEILEECHPGAVVDGALMDMIAEEPSDLFDNEDSEKMFEDEPDLETGETGQLLPQAGARPMKTDERTSASEIGRLFPEAKPTDENGIVIGSYIDV